MRQSAIHEVFMNKKMLLLFILIVLFQSTIFCAPPLSKGKSSIRSGDDSEQSRGRSILQEEQSTAHGGASLDPGPSTAIVPFQGSDRRPSNIDDFFSPLIPFPIRDGDMSLPKMDEFFKKMFPNGGKNFSSSFDNFFNSKFPKNEHDESSFTVDNIFGPTLPFQDDVDLQNTIDAMKKLPVTFPNINIHPDFSKEMRQSIEVVQKGVNKKESFDKIRSKLPPGYKLEGNAKKYIIKGPKNEVYQSERNTEGSIKSFAECYEGNDGNCKAFFHAKIQLGNFPGFNSTEGPSGSSKNPKSGRNSNIVFEPLQSESVNGKSNRGGRSKSGSISISNLQEVNRGDGVSKSIDRSTKGTTKAESPSHKYVDETVSVSLNNYRKASGGENSDRKKVPLQTSSAAISKGSQATRSNAVTLKTSVRLGEISKPNSSQLMRGPNKENSVTGSAIISASKDGSRRDGSDLKEIKKHLGSSTQPSGRHAYESVGSASVNNYTKGRGVNPEKEMKPLQSSSAANSQISRGSQKVTKSNVVTPKRRQSEETKRTKSFERSTGSKENPDSESGSSLASNGGSKYR